MIINVFYPPRKIYVSVAVKGYGEVYWKASDIVHRIYDFSHVSTVLKTYLYSGQLTRIRDFLPSTTHARTIYLTTEQVLQYISSVSRKNIEFSEWFENVSQGKTQLVPSNSDAFQLNLKNPDPKFKTFVHLAVDDVESTEEYRFKLPDLARFVRISKDICQRRMPESTTTINNDPIPDDKFIDSTKSFDYLDKKSDQVYKYVAINLKWPTKKPLDMYPYMRSDIADSPYLFVPIFLKQNTGEESKE